MATVEESLGKKHRKYNTTQKRVITENLKPLEAEFTPSDNDTENFMKIDIACHNRNVGYILSVLKCADSVYVSRALKRSAWLVTEPAHAHVVNPQYLHQHLFPHMTTKNYIKLIKLIKLTLKDETRAEEFYLSEKDPKAAIAWLPLCSVTFIECNIERHLGNDTDHIKLGDLKIRTFKKLCEKSETIFEIVMNKTKGRPKKHYLQAVTFLLNTNIDLFLNILENISEYERISLNEHATDLIMKHSPKRVIEKFEQYIDSIHVPTFAKHLKRDYIKTFLYEQAKKDLQHPDLRRMRNLYHVYFKYFIKRLPKDEQFKFVKDVFIDRVFTNVPSEKLLPDTEPYGMMKLCDAIHCNAFDWYEYASFETANEAYIKEITEQPALYDKYSMLAVLVKCADHNLQQIRIVLQHFLEEHKKNTDGFIHLKYNFINNLLEATHIIDYDEVTWNILNDIFTAVNVYEQDNDNDGQCVQSIIIYSTLHGITIPEIIQKKFEFNTLKSYKTKMNKEQKEKIFSYLYEYLLSSLKEPIPKEDQFAKCVKTLENVLQLLIDWDKELVDHPLVLNTINEYVNLKKENSWKTNLSSLYNVNKKWRRVMFPMSLSLSRSEETCLNALKHEPQLLVTHSAELRAADTAPSRLLAKLRIYWPHIAKTWIDEYLKTLNESDANKALLRGLCTLLPREPLNNLIKENAPDKARIDWNETDERTIALRRFIASNMHVARPQPTPDAILMYAKGDYLKFALPSVLAIFYNQNPSLFRTHIPQVLDAPVSLQKHGLRFVYRRCNDTDIKEIFLNTWKTCKNLSIRAVIFNFTHTLLCNAKDDTKAVESWKLTETFIDNLTYEEDKKIYELLFKVENVPLVVRGKYLMKSYGFMKQYLLNAKNVDENYKRRVACLGEYSRNILELLSTDFVTGLIDSFVAETYLKENVGSSDMIQVISAYLLCAKNELTQWEKYEKVLIPIMRDTLPMMNKKSELTNNFRSLVACLRDDLQNYVIPNNMIVPTKIFVAIQAELIKSIPIHQNYILLTEWRLLVAFTQLLEKTYSTDNNWSDLCTTIAPDFGKICVDYLKEDIKVHFPCIYLLFSKALNGFLNSCVDRDVQEVIFEQFLIDEEFIAGYLVTIQLLGDKINCNSDGYKNIGRMLSNHPSVEIRFHCIQRIPNLNVTAEALRT